MKRYYNTKGSAERIRQLRKRSHITQSMLAEQANISVDTVKRLERGNEGSVNVLLAIADVYERVIGLSLIGCEDAADKYQKNETLTV